MFDENICGKCKWHVRDDIIEKEDSKTVKLDKLMVARLYKVGKKTGYVTRERLYHACRKYGFDLDNGTGLDLKSQYVIIKRPKFGRTPKFVE